MLTQKRRIWISRKNVVNLSWQSGKSSSMRGFPAFFRSERDAFSPPKGTIRQEIEKITKPREKISGGIVSSKYYLRTTRSAGKSKRKLYLLNLKCRRTSATGRQHTASTYTNFTIGQIYLSFCHEKFAFQGQNVKFQ